jgi:hypothetical protein
LKTQLPLVASHALHGAGRPVHYDRKQEPLAKHSEWKFVGKFGWHSRLPSTTFLFACLQGRHALELFLFFVKGRISRNGPGPGAIEASCLSLLLEAISAVEVRAWRQGPRCRKDVWVRKVTAAVRDPENLRARSRCFQREYFVNAFEVCHRRPRGWLAHTLKVDSLLAKIRHDRSRCRGGKKAC